MAANGSPSSLSSCGTRGTSGASCSSARGICAKREQPREAQQAGGLVHVVLVDLELLQEQLADAVRHARRQLEPHGGSEAALAQLAIDGRQQIGGFVFQDVEIHVARDAKRVAADHVHTREQVRQIAGDQLLERHVVGGLAGAAADSRRAARSRRSAASSPAL